MAHALNLKMFDVLGFSIGGTVRRGSALPAPTLERRLILVGTGPRGAEGIAPMTEAAAEIFSAAHEPAEHLWLAVRFTPSAASQAAGLAYLMRKQLRKGGRDPESNDKVGTAQIEALGKYGAQFEGVLDYLKDICQPTLIVQGYNEVIAPPDQFLYDAANHSRCAVDPVSGLE